MKTEEQEYIKRILGGEMELYGYFLDTYGHRIFTLVQQMVSNREDAWRYHARYFRKSLWIIETLPGRLRIYHLDIPSCCNVTASILRKTNSGKNSFFWWEYTRTYRERRVGDSFRYNRWKRTRWTHRRSATCHFLALGRRTGLDHASSIMKTKVSRIVLISCNSPKETSKYGYIV